MKTAIALLAVATLSPACISQQPTAQDAKPFVVEPGEIPLMALVDRCAAHMEWNILVSEQEIAGGGNPLPIRLQQRVETDRAGCEDFLANMLWRNSLVLTILDEKQRLYEVISIQGPRQREVLNRAVSRTPEEVLARPTLRMPVMTVVQLLHVNATIATNALRPFFASTGGATSMLSIGNIGNSTSLLLSGMQDQVAAAIGILRTADVPGRAELEHMGGPQTANRLGDLERRVEQLEKKFAAQGQPAQPDQPNKPR